MFWIGLHRCYISRFNDLLAHPGKIWQTPTITGQLWATVTYSFKGTMSARAMI